MLGSSGIDSRKVFVVHGRDQRLRADLFAFLRAIGLAPIEWSEAVKMTGKGSPFIGEILDVAFAAAQAVVVLLTPDDEVRLSPELTSPHDPPDEREFRLQARPNVLFEAGTAFGRSPDRTVIIEVGRIKHFSDVAGRHGVRLTNDAASRNEVVVRLRTAGCPVSTDGTDWLRQGDFVVNRVVSNTASAKVPAEGSSPNAFQPPFCPRCSTTTTKRYLTRLSNAGQKLYDATHECDLCLYREKFS